MKATLLPIDMDDLLRRAHAARVQDRKPGIHSSDIIKYIMRKIEPERFSQKKLDSKVLHMGFVWEDLFAWTLARQLGMVDKDVKQVQLNKDDIWRTLDGFRMSKSRPVEFKGTKMSARNHVVSAKYRHWEYQIADYCNVTEERQAELYVMHINGNYEDVQFGQPIVNPWLIEFTPHRLTEIEDMIRRERDRMVKDRDYMRSIGKEKYAE